MIYLRKNKLILPGDPEFAPPGVCSLLGQRSMMAAAGAGADVTVSFQAVQKNATNLTAYTFNGSAIGATAGRTGIVMGINGRHAGSTAGVLSVTVDTVGATEAIEAVSGDSSQSTALWYFDNPSGTTADLVITFNGTQNMMSVAVWAIYNAAAGGPSDTDASAAANPQTTSLVMPAGGAAFAILIDDTANAGQYTWTDNASNIVIEDFDENMGTANPVTSGGSAVSATAINPYIITATADGNDAAVQRMVGATWAKA